MNSDSVYRDLALLMAGLASIAVLGGVVLVNSVGQPARDLSDVDAYEALRLLTTAEYAQLARQFRLAPDVIIAIGSGVSGNAAEVLQRFGHPWIREQRWESNRGVPPPGTVLVRELRIDQDVGYFVAVIGETASLEGCGYTVESQHIWQGAWTNRAVTRMAVC